LRSEQFTLKREQFCTVLILDWVYLHSDCGNRRGCRIGFFEESGKGKLRSAIDGDEEIEFAFFCPDLGDVDVEEADRVGLEFLLGCFFAFDFGNREMPWRCRQRWSDERVRCGIVACRA
jgi:hypothetical protein